MASVRQFPTIKSVRSFVIGGVGSGVWKYSNGGQVANSPQVVITTT